MSMRRCTPYIVPILLFLAGCGDTPKPKDPPLNLPIKGETPKAETPKEEPKSSATALTHLPTLGEKLVVPEPTIDLTQKAPDTYIGSNKAPDGQPMKVHTVLVTRKSDTVFQGLVRYEPRQVPITQVPGISDLRDYFAAGGQVLPGMLLLLEQETEVLLDNLNTPMRSITSSKLFLNPLNGHAVAYDIANTSGGQPQRFVGHLTRRGIHVDVFRGSEYVDQHDLPFVSRDTFIPYEIEFIHQWYTQNPEERGKTVKFSIFMPEVMSYVLLSAKPLGDEIIPIKDTNYECARYEVTTASMQALDGLTAKQIMWFDKRTGLLQRREDFETSLAPGDAPVSERGNVEDLKRLSRLTVRPPQLPEKAFPFALDRDQAYTIRTRDKDLGRLSVRYSKNPQGGYTATANVNMEGEGVAVSRTELAITQLDERFMPRDYQANGEEKSDGSTKYKVTAKMAGGRVEMVTDREYVPPPPEAAPANTEKKEPVEEWTDPIRRVPLSDAEARAEAAAQVKPRSVNQSISRALSPGTFFYDFNRIEHLAAFAHRLPIPTIPPDLGENDPPPLAFQKVALFAVRQNRAGVVQFEIKPEPKPRMTERQKKRLAAQKSAGEPQLYVATCSSPILPCRMLLTADGRLLELTLQFGSNEVTYTLDDPIMQKRLERAKKQELQVGPVLIRPPWY